MDMDLVIIFAFVSTIVLIITAGVVLFPIARKLGYFLEQAARERAEKRVGTGERQQLPSGAYDELLHALGSLETRVTQLAERQTFSEDLLEKRARPILSSSPAGTEPD
jgi:hypothetical protein